MGKKSKNAPLSFSLVLFFIKSAQIFHYFRTKRIYISKFPGFFVDMYRFLLLLFLALHNLEHGVLFSEI